MIFYKLVAINMQVSRVALKRAGCKMSVDKSLYQEFISSCGDIVTTRSRILVFFADTDERCINDFHYKNNQKNFQHVVLPKPFDETCHKIF